MLANTRSNHTPNLVDQVFGEVATIRHASLVLLIFLHSKLLVVELDGKELLRDQWPEACALAASSADARAYPTNVDSSSDWTERNYVWKWCEILDQGTVRGVEVFFNVVGLSAYVAAMTTGVGEGLSNRTITTRFATLPRSYGPLPAPTSNCSSYSPPHFFVIPSTSFVSENTRNVSGRPEEFLKKDPPLAIIKEKFPFLLSGFVHIFPDSVDHLEVPLQTGPSNGSSQSKHPTASSASTVSIRDELMAFSASLKAETQPYAFPKVEQILCEQSQRCFLDLSRVCAPEVLLPGVMSVDISLERVQRVRQHQRRSQPWIRSLLGLAITEDELGLFRADAVGLKKCIFDRTTGFGVIQCIRIALGILVATSEELGIHPAFSFRETVSKPLPQSDHDVGGKRTASDVEREMPSNKIRIVDDEYHLTSMECAGTASRPRFYRYKEVNFCTLKNSNLHPPNCNIIEPEAKFYVKYLLEDQGSLFRRSTRVWCVYKEVPDEERKKYLQENAAVIATPLFVGPFALKMYNADVNSEAYKYDLVQKAIAANVKYVVLPKHVWHLGKVVQDLRPGYLQLHDSELDDCEEIMMISPFKRTLAQFSDTDEFYRGLIDALKGIESLANAGLMHCDVSIANILLEAETYPESKDVIDFVTVSVDGIEDTKIALLFQPSGSEGGLHDLDLMERVPSHEESDQSKEKSNRVGTIPFMSIECLTGTKHIVVDDMQSLFYVLFLSMFQLAGPVPNCYPSAPEPITFEYPRDVSVWADDESAIYGWTQERLYQHLRAMKLYFFQWKRQDEPHPQWYPVAATQSLPFWRDRFLVHRVFLTAFHEDPWFKAASGGGETFYLPRKKSTSPRMLIEKLERYEEKLRDLLKSFK